MAEKKLSILVVDNNEHIRGMMLNLLKEHPPIVVKTAAESLEALKKNEINVVIQEMELPDISGTELIAKLKAIKPEIFIIVATTKHDKRTVTSCLTAGAKGFIIKPIQKATLDRYIEKYSKDNIFEELF
jgi:DNA-binding NtrC family response regulator